MPLFTDLAPMDSVNIEVVDLWGNPDPALTPVRALDVLRGAEHSGRAVSEFLAGARRDETGTFVVDLTAAAARELLERLDRQAATSRLLSADGFA